MYACTFFEGYVDSVPEAASFDAALCLLVSYFLLDPGERHALFSAIARRLRRGGLLVNAELTADVSTARRLGGDAPDGRPRNDP